MGVVYVITNLRDHKSYVGSSTQLNIRLHQHKNGTREWQREFASHPEQFEVKIVAQTEDIRELEQLELKFIEEYDSVRNGYNTNRNTSRVKYDNKELNSKVHRDSMTKEVRDKIRQGVRAYYSDPTTLAEHSRKTKEAMARLNQKWIHKDGVRHKIASAELNSWIEDGWELGKG